MVRSMKNFFLKKNLLLKKEIAFGELLDIYFFESIEPKNAKETLQSNLPNGIKLISAEDVAEEAVSQGLLIRRSDGAYLLLG